MRITLLSWRDTTHPDGGGAERYLEELAARLTAAGDDVTILCAKHPGASRDEVLNGVRFRRRGGRLTVYPHGLAFLLTRVGRDQDIVVDVVNGVPFAARLVRRRGLVMLLHHLHRAQWRMIYPGWPGRLGWFVESRITPWLYRDVPVVTVSSASRDDLAALGFPPSAITIIRNGVDVPVEVAPRSVEPRLCVLARLVPHKQVDEALLVLAELKPAHPTLHLDVIGDGAWREQLIEYAAELGIADRVTFHGRVTASERDRLLATSWAMLLPSLKEGWGLAVSEAGAVGTPTIAYRSAGGTRESVVDGVTGLLADDRNEFIRSTKAVLADPALRERLGSAARERAASLDWGRSATELRDLLRAISDRRTGRSARRPDSSRARR